MEGADNFHYFYKVANTEAGVAVLSFADNMRLNAHKELLHDWLLDLTLTSQLIGDKPERLPLFAVNLLAIRGSAQTSHPTPLKVKVGL